MSEAAAHHREGDGGRFYFGSDGALTLGRLGALGADGALGAVGRLGALGTLGAGFRSTITIRMIAISSTALITMISPIGTVRLTGFAAAGAGAGGADTTGGAADRITRVKSLGPAAALDGLEAPPRLDSGLAPESLKMGGGSTKGADEPNPALAAGDAGIGGTGAPDASGDGGGGVRGGGLPNRLPRASLNGDAGLPEAAGGAAVGRGVVTGGGGLLGAPAPIGGAPAGDPDSGGGPESGA